MSKVFAKSIWVYHFAASPCNNCDIEILDTLTPKFDAERFGVKLVGSIRHADCMLITGALNSKVLPRLKRILKQAPEPFFVIAIGTCALDLGVFRGSYNVVGPVDKHIKVDVYVPGCPPKPEAMLAGVVKLKEKVLAGEKKKGVKKL
ncbi:MAG: NADH-quinone oxidoreductase subunit NuoB [Elusimicrobia bacterium]|jgi:membrane-bound hydrogenase subunit mbhJ|nr:NADH-quinone oxidoreductase subunit NuoB [Elusimicrobiota bacterium]